MRTAGLVRRLVVVVVVAVLVPACQPGPPTPGPSEQTSSTPASATPVPEPEPEPVKVLHWNVAGALLEHNIGQMPVMDELVARVRSDRPDVISLNEVCGSQNEYLTEQIKELGYVGNFAGNNRNVLCGVSVHENMGVAVYIAGGAAPGSGNDYAVGQSTACLTRAGRRPIRACSTHLTSPNRREHPEEDVTREVDSLTSTVLAPYSHLPVVVAGDFNLRSTNAGMRRVYQRFYELDAAGPPCGDATGPDSAGGGCTFPASKPAKKLDYVFVDKEHFLERTEATLTGPGSCRILVAHGYTERPCSDHQQYSGTAYLRPDGATTTEPTATTSSPAGTTPGVAAELPLTMKWTLQLKPGTTGRADLVALMYPRWSGTLSVDTSGTVTGSGKLSVISTQFCREKIDTVRFTAGQSVTVSGRIDPAAPVTRDPTLALNLTFGAPTVTGRAKPACQPSVDRYLGPLRSFVALRSLQGTLRGSRYRGWDPLALTANGRPVSLDGYRER